MCIQVDISQIQLAQPNPSYIPSLLPDTTSSPRLSPPSLSRLPPLQFVVALHFEFVFVLHPPTCCQLIHNAWHFEFPSPPHLPPPLPLVSPCALLVHMQTARKYHVDSGLWYYNDQYVLTCVCVCHLFSYVYS